MIGLIGGYGSMGQQVMANLLSMTDNNILVGGRHPERANVSDARVTSCYVNTNDDKTLLEMIEQCEIIINCLGGEQESHNRILKLCMDSHCHYVDLNMAGGIYDADVSSITFAGIFPGLAGLVQRYVGQKFDHIESYHFNMKILSEFSFQSAKDYLNNYMFSGEVKRGVWKNGTFDPTVPKTSNAKVNSYYYFDDESNACVSHLSPEYADWYLTLGSSNVESLYQNHIMEFFGDQDGFVEKFCAACKADCEKDGYKIVYEIKIKGMLHGKIEEKTVRLEHNNPTLLVGAVAAATATVLLDENQTVKNTPLYHVPDDFVEKIMNKLLVNDKAFLITGDTDLFLPKLEYSSLDDLLFHASSTEKKITFLLSNQEQKEVSYKQLYDKACSIADNFINREYSNRHILIQLENNYQYVLAFWGIVLSGNIPVILPDSIITNQWQKKQLQKVNRQFSDLLVITNKSRTNQYDEMEQNQILFMEDLRSENNGQRVVKLHKNENDVAIILYSSGSTGEPKRIPLTHKNILKGIDSVKKCAKYNEKDVFMCCLPLTHITGFKEFHLTPLKNRNDQIIVSPELFIQSPENVCTLLKEHKATIVSGMNYMFQTLTSKMLTVGKKDIYDFSSVRVWIIAGEPIHYEKVMQFINLAKQYGLKEEAVTPAYGATETSGILTLGEIDKVIHQEKNPNYEGMYHVATGTISDEISVQVLDEQGRVLADNEIGMIYVSGDMVCEQYKNSQGFYDTGDLGFTNQGELYITGRKDEILFVNGQNYFTKDIEYEIEHEFPSLSGKIAVLSTVYKGENVGILLMEHQTAIDEFARTCLNIRNFIQKQMHIVLDYFIPIDGFQKTNSMKRNTKINKERFLKGEYDEIIKSIQHEMVLAENEMFTTELSEESRVIYDSLAEIIDTNKALSSIDYIKISGILEQQFDVEIDIKQLYELADLRRIANYAISKMSTLVADVEQMKWKQESDENSTEFPLTEIQSAYVNGRNELYDIGGTSTHIYYEYKWSGSLSLLEEALNLLIESEPMLRVKIINGESQSIQEHVPRVSIGCVTVGKDESVEEKQLEVRESMSHHMFDLNTWPLYRMKALRMEENNYLLFLEIDLILLDAGSIILFQQRLMELYHDLTTLGVDAVKRSLYQYNFSFKEFVVTSQKVKQSERYVMDKAYWLKRIDTSYVSPLLPLCTDSLQVKKPAFRRLTMTYTKEETELIYQYSKKAGISVSTFFLGIYGKILSWISNQKKILINVTTSNRTMFHPDVAKMLGEFTSTMLMDIDFEQVCFTKEETLHTYFSEVQDKILGGLEHWRYSGVELAKELSQKNKTSSYSFAPYVFTSTLNLTDITDCLTPGEMIYGISQTSQVYLDCQIYENHNQFTLNWDYVEQLFDNEMITHLWTQFHQLIRTVMKEGKSKTESFDIVPSDRKRIEQYNNTKADYPNGTLLELVERSIAKYPERIALVDKNSTITYRELEEKSNFIAAYLQAQGVSRGDCIGIIARRNWKSIIGIIAIIKCGAAYVPLDSNWPEQRIQTIMEKSGCFLLLDVEKVPKDFTGARKEVSVAPEDLAYIIYTSGSTGTPKGVVIKNSAVVNTILDINEKIHLTEEDRIIGLSSMCFDLSVYDIFGAFSVGASLYMVPDITDQANVRDIVYKNKITIWNSVPAIMKIMVSMLELNDVEPNNCLREVLLSGDWIGLEQPEKIKKYFPSANVYSLGGATEASIWSIYYPITTVQKDWSSIPYGYPLANQSIYILDEQDSICNIGVIGEICIGGIGIANGYRNEPEKTAASFITHKELGPIYKTGDYGVMTKNGYVVFIGRRDGQVKIGGHRIEMGEIKSNILNVEGVKDCLVMIDELTDGSKILVAFVVCNEESYTKIPEQIEKSLPYYMVPKHLIRLDEMPLTENQKINRKKLKELLVIKSDEEKAFEPETVIEEQIYELWKQVFEMETIPETANFYDCGGDSIKMIRLSGLISNHFKHEISYSKIMSAPTIKRQSMLVQELLDQGDTVSNQILFRVHNEDWEKAFPLTDMQTAYLIGRSPSLPLGNISTHAYYEYRCSLNLERLEQAVNYVIGHQPGLRMVIDSDGNQIVKQDIPPFKIERIDCSGFSETKVNALLRRERRKISHRVFDATKWPMYAMKALVFSDTESYLLFDVDMLVMDYFSLLLFRKQVMTAYYSETMLVKEFPLSCSFRDFVMYFKRLKETKKYKEDKQYWQEKIKSFHQPYIICKMDEIKNITPYFSRKSYQMEKEKWAKLKEILNNKQISQSSYIAVLFAKVLKNWTKQDAGILNITTFNRISVHPDMDSIIGDFTSNMIVNFDFTNELDEFDMACQVQKDMIDGLEHNLYSGIEVIKDFAKEQGEDAMVLPIVFTSTLGSQRDNETYNFGELEYAITQTSQLYLDCQVYEIDNELSVNWDYASNILKEEEVEKAFSDFVNAISSF